MKVLVELLAGSHLYGLTTPTSDVDERCVYLATGLNESPLSLDAVDCQDARNETQDRLCFELRRFVHLLRKTNTQMIELVFAEDFTRVDPEFKRLILDQKYRLMDSATLYSSLLGYIKSERRLANGERMGRLGGKRKEQLDKYGFSPKNFSHLLRLTHCGKVFFDTGVYPVNVMRQDESVGKLLLDIKVNPQNWGKDALNRMVDIAEEKLHESYRETKIKYTFDLEYANKAVLQLYYPVLSELNEKA